MVEIAENSYFNSQFAMEFLVTLFKSGHSWFAFFKVYIYINDDTEDDYHGPEGKETSLLSSTSSPSFFFFTGAGVLNLTDFLGVFPRFSRSMHSSSN